MRPLTIISNGYARPRYETEDAAAPVQAAGFSGGVEPRAIHTEAACLHSSGDVALCPGANSLPEAPRGG
jgi:hypothetical protein